MKIFIPLFIILTSVHSMAESLVNWQELDSRATLATRLSYHDQPIETGEYLSESTIIADHQYQSLILAWRLNSQLYQSVESHKLKADTDFELSELSYSFSLLEDESDFWQLGKFNYPLDPGYVLRSVAFFESANNPFDDFSSTEGINMASASLWLGDYYFSLITALEGATPITEDLYQWAIVMQTDFDALSTNFIAQQYENSHLGFGATFTYVVGDNWEFHGSGLLRQGSVWRAQFNDTPISLTENNDEKWHPKFVVGTFWTVNYLTLLMEYSFQTENLSTQELAEIDTFQPQSADEVILYRSKLTQLYQQEYQQEYLFAQLQYSQEDHIITVNSLIGKDISAISQLKYEYLATFNLTTWLSMELVSGKNNTQFTHIPWENRLQVGLQWKL